MTRLTLTRDNVASLVLLLYVIGTVALLFGGVVLDHGTFLSDALFYTGLFIVGWGWALHGDQQDGTQ